MRQRYFRACSIFLACLVTCFCLALAGCSSGGSSGGSGGGGGDDPDVPGSDKYATVKFEFDLASAKVEIPYEVASLSFTGYSDESMTKAIDHQPWQVEKDNPSQHTYQTVTLTKVPLETVRFRIDYLDEDGESVGYSKTNVLKLEANKTYTATVGEIIPIESDKYATVKFEFDLASAKVEVPYKVATFKFTGYSNESMTKAIDHQPWQVEKDNPSQHTYQTVTLTKVPLETVRFRIDYLDEDGESVGYSKTNVLRLEADKTYTATVGEIIPIEKITLEVSNGYNKYASKADYVVRYNSTAGNDLIATGVTDYSYGYCKFIATVEGEGMAVSAVKLSNHNTEIPFEWIDYVSPITVTNKYLLLNVDDNKFAGGTGTESEPYLVGNPRQLDNVRDDCGNAIYYRQFKNIDLEGACGITATVSLDASNNIVSTSKVVDSSARFYNEGKGWLPIGSNDTTPFAGTYDGAGNSIDGIVIYSPEADTSSRGHGLFGQVGTCCFTDITLGSHCVIVGNYSAGALFGATAYDKYDTTVKVLRCCTNDVVVMSTGKGSTGTAAYFAGSCGCLGGYVAANFVVEQCQTSGKIYTFRSAGGMLGCALSHADCSVAGCTFEGTLVGSRNGTAQYNMCGGLLGETQVPALTIKDCTVDATIKLTVNTTSNLAGGLLAQMNMYEVKLEGQNNSKLKFNLPSGAGRGFVLGGIFGSVNYYSAKASELKAIMKDHVNVSSITGLPESGGSCGKYCGDPTIDSLD